MFCFWLISVDSGPFSFTVLKRVNTVSHTPVIVVISSIICTQVLNILSAFSNTSTIFWCFFLCVESNTLFLVL